MNNYNAKEVLEGADYADSCCLGHEANMLREFAALLRRQEEEEKRDPVMEPRAGDRIQIGSDHHAVYTGMCSDQIHTRVEWKERAKLRGAKIIRRRESD